MIWCGCAVRIFPSTQTAFCSSFCAPFLSNWDVNNILCKRFWCCCLRTVLNNVLNCPSIRIELVAACLPFESHIKNTHHQIFGLMHTVWLSSNLFIYIINGTPQGVHLPISKLHSILAVANLLAHNNRSQICYCGQISWQSAAVNCSFSDYLAPLGVKLTQEPIG